MANLGSTDTPVKGQEFALPAGAKLDEDGGDLVVRDSDGTIVLRRDEATDSWVTDALTTEKIGNERHYAGAYSGADADARLDSAISAAANGDVIHLESATYSDDRTISKNVRIVGTISEQNDNGSVITGDWTLSAQGLVLKHCRVVDGDLNPNATSVAIIECNGNGSSATITVGDDRIRIVACDQFAVTFENGTSGGIVDACAGTSVTDNGTNTSGDIG